MGIYMWRERMPQELCFTANTAGSTVQLTQTWSPTAVTLETSSDGDNWNTYTIWTTITLSNIWDKVYFRNTSETTTWFSTSGSNYYQFVMSWSINGSWDINYLLNKNSTDEVTAYWFIYLFMGCASLVTPPSLPATSVQDFGYYAMFNSCSWLTTVPSLPATTIGQYCYYGMFVSCSELATIPELPATSIPTYAYWFMFNNSPKIKVSETQTWEYQTPYRIPKTWTWSAGSSALSSMFNHTWWTFKWTPTINTTYYTSNTVV